MKKQVPSVQTLIQRKGAFRLPLTLGRYAMVYGGPFSLFDPRLARGICLAPEVRAAELADVLIPTPDFGLPPREAVLSGLDLALDYLINRDPLYVGCMGGIGRTGTFLALLAKLMGSKNPINDVRASYYAHAVETRAQEQFVDSFEFPFALKFKACRLMAGAIFNKADKPINDRVTAMIRPDRRQRDAISRLLNERGDIRW